MTSPSSSAPTDAHGARLLPDRDVEEPGQLACAEPFLDLLLETPDEQHLSEELAEEVLGDGAFFSTLANSALSLCSGS